MVTTFTKDPIQKYSSDIAVLGCSSDDTNLKCYTEDTSLGCPLEDSSLDNSSDDTSLDSSSDDTSLDSSSNDTMQDYSLDDRMQDNSSPNIILSNSPYQSADQDRNYSSHLKIVVINPDAVATYVTSVYTAACNNTLDAIDKSRINEQNSAGETPLMIAVREQNPTAVTMLTRHGADLEISKDPDGKFTALSLAGVKGYVDVVKTLVGLGARVDCMESGTILNMARENGFLEDIVYLENEFRRHEGLESSALYLAVEVGDLETVQALVKCGADLDKLDKFGQTVLQRAINSQHMDIAECLIHAGVYLDSKDFYGRTAFNLDKMKKLISLLLEKGADPNIKDTRGRSLLFRSLEENHLNLANVLIEGNADVNTANEVGETPLNIAVNRNDTDMIKNLLRKGADVNLYGGKFLPNPIRVAETGNVEMMKLFLQHKADVDVTVDGVNALFISIEKNDTNMWELLVGNGAGLEAFNARGETVLMMAVKAGNIDLLRHLVQHGADVDCLNSRRVSALYEAVILRSCEAVQLLVEAGAALDTVYFNDGSILTLALRKQRKDIAALIVKTKLNTREEIDMSRTSDTDEFDFINVVNRRLQTALHIAASIDSCYLVNLLTDAGADVNMTDDNNNTALQIGISNIDNKDMVEILLEAGADPNVLDEHGETPLLHTVTYAQGFPIARLLIQHNSNVNIKNKHGQTPLMLAVEQGNIEIINLLLDHDAKVVHKTNLGLDAVQRAIFKRSVISLKSLNRAGADINARNSSGETYLIQSVKRLQLEIVDVLIKSGADVNAQDSEGKSALLHNRATHSMSFYRIEELLLAAGANVNIQDNNGETHLIQMVKSLRIETVDLMIKSGADVNAQDNEGRTALMHNTSRSFSRIEELLLKAGANVNMQDRNGETHLIQMVKLSKPDIVNRLIISGADVNVQDNDGKTALMHNAATQSTSFSRIEALLLADGANVNMQDKKGKTALMYTAKYKTFHTSSQLHTAENININIEDNKHRTALYYAFKNIHIIFPSYTITEVNASKFNAELLLNLKINPCLNIDQQIFESLFSRCGLLAFNNEISNFNRFEHMRLCVSNGYMYKHQKRQTLLCLAMSNGRAGVIKYLISNCYLMSIDLRIIQAFSKHPRASTPEIKRAACNPWPLVKLAFIAVSTRLGSGANRTQRIQSLELPVDLQDALMFTTPIARLARKKWSKIPVCFDVEEYEKLENPRPLLRFWPYDIAVLGCSSDDTNLKCYTEDTSLGCPLEDSSLDNSSDDTSLDSSSDDTSLDSSSNDTMQDYSLDDRMQDNSSPNIILSNSPYQSADQDRNYSSHLKIVVINPDAVATYVTSVYTAACNNTLDAIDKSRINEQNSAGETPLMIAVREQNPTAVTMLTRHGADLEISKDPDGKFTALSLAGVKGYVDVVKTLVGLGARVDCMESGTILNMARENGFLEDIVYLENEFRRHEGLESSALYLAVEVGDLETVQALVKCGADLDKLDKFGQTVLQRAINSQHMDIAECLIHAGVYLDSKDFYGRTAFNLDKMKKLISLLLEKGADPNIKDSRGRSLLFRSLEENHLNLANVLIEGNADVNTANEVGETPLNIAVNRNDTDMIKNLLRKGADVNLYGGKFLPNPIRVAETGNFEMMKLFLQHKADVDVTVDGVNALFISIEKNDTNMWELLVGNGAGLEAFNARGETVLMMAVKAGNIDLLRHLVQHGADVDCLNSRRVSALYEAVILRSCEAVQLLVEAGAALDTVYFNDGSILHLALRKQRKDIAALIVKTKLNTREEIDMSRTSDTDEFDFINVVNRRLQTALHIAASIDSCYLVNLLTDAGADVNMTDDNNNTALQIGISNIDNKDMVEILLEAGADPNVLDEHGETPLLHAVTCAQGFPIARLLIQHNSNVNIKNKHGQTPLMLAVEQGNIEIINLLLDHDAKVVHKTNLGLDAVQRAIFKRSVISLKSLNRAGADINARNSSGETYLIQSVKRLQLEIVDVLIKSGADVNAQDSEGKSALLHNRATHSMSFYRIEELLLAAGANVNIQDNNGETHLIQMVKSLRIETVDLMIKSGADVNAQDNEGRTALMHNTSRSFSRIEELLLKAGANVNMQDRNGETHLIQMVKLSKPDIVNRLIISGADVNVQDNDGKTALMHNAATQSTSFSRIEALLLADGANVNMQDKKGKTALMYTAKYKTFHTSSQLHTAENININIEDNKHRTALYYAFKNIHIIFPSYTITEVNASKFNAELLLNLKINPCLYIDQQIFESLFSRCGLLAFNNEISNFNRFEHMRLCVSNGYMYKHQKRQTLLCLAMSNGRAGVIKYLISNCYLMSIDLRIIQAFSKHPRASTPEIKRAACNPWPLVKLAFIAVSTRLGSGANRTQRIQSLELPIDLQDALMFRTPIARLARKKWSKIPVCFDVEEYEKLENPRPLLRFWPYGCFLRL
ncbi:uncharacterized protein LOC131957434 [Physella acuta]|uniref:uncharacterized protein LOC131957434 n=1 Tax=Physella acuta TaxID=109671 RepID=UPI0027DAFAD0|nr:uncharacterized protein LOC131957434 [Physella acuta]